MRGKKETRKKAGTILLNVNLSDTISRHIGDSDFFQYSVFPRRINVLVFCSYVAGRQITYFPEKEFLSLRMFDHYEIETSCAIIQFYLFDIL